MVFWARSRLLWRRDQGFWLARRPDTFSGKVRWKMLKDRRPLLTTFTDKVAVRDYVARTVGAHRLSELFDVIDDVAKLDVSRLPREFVAKASHASGGVWIVADCAQEGFRVEGHENGEERDSGQAWSRVLTRPDSVDWDAFRTTLSRWLSARFTDTHAAWAYLGIPPRILFEEVLHEASGELARDYKFFVFHGTAQVVQTHTDRFGSHRQNMYLRDWTALDVEFRYPCGPVEAEPPSLGEMIDVAERLARETDFVRVDLYAAGDRVVFGELTNYPDAGRGIFDPASFDDDLGRWWTLPRRYRTPTTSS